MTESLAQDLAIKDSFFELSTSTDLKLGDVLKGSYSVDLNIIDLHLIIRDIFTHKISLSKKCQEKISIIDKNLEKKDISFLAQKELLRKREVEQENLEKFSLKEWKTYCDKVRPILEQYSKVTTQCKSKTIVVGSKKSLCDSKNINLQESNLRNRLSLINSFLKLVKKYVEVDIIFHPPFNIGCSECDLSIDHMKIDEDQGVYVCDCNFIFGSVYSLENSHIDPDKIDSGLKASYDDKTNFQRRLKSYQGFQNRKIPKELIDSLDLHMQEKYKHPPAAEIQKMPADKYGHRGPMTSVPLLIVALKETGNSIHFQDINPICYELWGWVCPNIDHLVPKILDDYTRTQEVYKKLRPDDSSINVELRLYWHLRIAGHDCLLEDFKIPHSRPSRKENTHTFQIMCEETGLPFFPIL